MADDVSAGRLRVDAYADTSGFAREAKAKIDAELKNLRAKIKVELDDRGIIKQARETALKAQQAATVKLKAQLDARGLQAQAVKAAQEASNKAKVQIGADLNHAEFERDLAATVAALDNRYRITVGVDLDTAAAQARVEAFRAQQRNLPIQLGANIQLGNLSSVITQVAKLPAMAGGIYVLVGALTQTAGGLFAIASAASQAVTTVAALPNLLGAVGQAGAVLIAGFSGIGEAIGELGEQDAASATQTQKAADIRTNSARAVADAQRNLKDAYHQAADAARFAGYAVQDAEWGLARAQEAAAEAQEALNEARVAARENLDELHESLRRAALTEAQASNALQKARQNLQDVMWDKSSTGQEQKDARLAVKEAKVNLAEVRDAHGDLAAEVAKADAAGVDGAEQVQQAREGVRDANHSLMLAERQLKEARHSAADTAESNAAMIAAAQQAITDAQKGGTQAAQAQTAALAEQTSAYDKLNPAAQRFATFLFEEVMPRFGRLRDSVQEALLPPLEDGIRKAMPLIDTLETGLVGTAEVVGDLAIKVGELFGSNGFNDNTAAIMGSNNRVLRSFGKTLLNLIEWLSDVAVVAGPTLAEPFARWTTKVTKGWKEAAKLGRETGTMADRFVRAREMAGQLSRIIGHVKDALHGMGKAALPAGLDLLDSMERGVRKWDEWANSKAGKERMEEFFESTKPVTEEFASLLGNVTKLVFKLGETGGGPITGALMALNTVVRALNAALSVPYLGQFLGWLLVAAGFAGALGLLAGMLVKVGGGIALLARVSGLIALWRAFSNTLLAVRIGLGLLWVQQKLAAAGAAILTGVMKVLRIAMATALGPVGLIILAIAAVAAGVVWAYKRFERFRRIVDAVFKFIVDGAKWLYDVLFGHSIFPDLLAGFRWVFKAIWIVIKVWWGIVKGYFRLVMDIAKAVGGAFVDLYKKYVKPQFEALGSIIKTVWRNVVKPIWDHMMDFLKKDIPDAFKSAVDRVKRIWEGIQKIASDPVEFIVNTVYNDGIRRVINAIPGVPDLDSISFRGFKTGGVLPGYTPGRDVHKFVSPTGGGLELSGGEAIMRPEWTRAVGVRGVEMMNAAARRGGAALKNVLTGQHGKHADGGIYERHAMGGVYSGVNRTLRFFLGGVMPLQGGALTNEHDLPYYNTGATFAGDLNGPYDLATPPGYVKAWKRGTIAQRISIPDSYGNHVYMNHPDGRTSLYAHMSSFIAKVGDRVAAGANIGRVGDTGHAFGSHLHFEVRGGNVPEGVNTVTTAADKARQAAVEKGEKEESSWRKAIGAIKDGLTSIPGMLSKLGDFTGWGGMLKDGMSNVGSDVIQWINDKIPDKIAIPKAPDIPLPDNPIPNPFKYDRGGDWTSGTAGVNLSGQTETVFTNENIVDLTGDLARIAQGLRSETVDAPAGRGGHGLNIEKLALTAAPDRVPEVMDDLQHALRVLSLGGVHVKHLAGASV